MPWLAPFEDAPDSHRTWADPGTDYERTMRHVGWCHEVAAPGSEPPVTEPPADLVPVEPSPVVEKPAPGPKLKGHRRAAVGRKP